LTSYDSGFHIGSVELTK